MKRDDRNIRIIIAGGGTGGHIFPGLAIAGSIQKSESSAEILFVGAKGKMEMSKVPEAGFSIQGIDIAGLNRRSVWKNLSLPAKLIKSYFQVRKILKDFAPDAVIGVGGYSSFPVLRLAQSSGIPTFIHESNSLPGKSNLMLAKRATGVFVATDGMEKYFQKDKIILSGNPVRSQILQETNKPDALGFFGLRPEYKTVLAMGGSLGARSINETIAGNIDFFTENNLQLIWQTGKNFSGHDTKEKEFSNIRTYTFISRMDLAYSAADVVIARAGAMTIAELQVKGKASILVPYPLAAEDHQTYNAKKLVEKKAAIMIADKDVREKLFPVLKELLGDSERMKTLENNISKEAKMNADEIVANEILKQIKR